MNPFSKLLFSLISCLPALVVNPVCAAPVSANFTSAATVPVIAASYTAGGNTVDISLGFAPPTGTNLTVVDNTGAGFIGGRFTNLAHGQVITLIYQNATYQFVANYHGGTGNDLVLQWAERRIYAWGGNARGEYGAGHTISSNVPVAVSLTGAISGRIITAIAKGSEHTMALCSDGTLAAWGANSNGQLGNGTTIDSAIPGAVTITGALSGKSVIAIAAGTAHSLALCSDGTLACWGAGSGNIPAALVSPGVLAGKSVTAIAAGADFSLALCADGTLAAWGNNASGQLGNGTTTTSSVPVAVTGILAGKTVTTISAGSSHCLAVCADGTLAAWGYNHYGNLGNGTVSNSLVPVAVNTSGILAGRTVTGIVAGMNHSLARCLDGTLAAWGYNSAGQLGNGTLNDRHVPAAVTKTLILARKEITSVTADRCSLALCADGSLASWGDNLYGQLGDGITYISTLPAAVSTAALATGERFTALAPGATARHAIALAAVPRSNISSLAALSTNPDTMDPAFAAGVTAYTMRVPHGTSSVMVTPTVTDAGATVTVNGVAVASGTPGPAIPLSPGHKTITVEVSAQNGTSTTYLVTVMDDATLAGLGVGGGTLLPGFSASVTSYSTYVASSTTAVRVTPVASDGAATIQVNGTSVVSGSASPPVNLVVGTNTITVIVTALDGGTTSYQISVLRPGPFTFTYTSADAVPPGIPGYIATDNTLSLSLDFAPATGTNLMVLNRPGNERYHDRFANLAQGQVVTLSYHNVNYKFVADYYGGTGNDLVLRWAVNKVYAWGVNSSGQLGTGNTTHATTPVAVMSSGVLAGKTVTAIAKGQSHSLALCADGTLAAWGSNASGQLGNGTTTNSLLPGAVTTNGVLTGKAVIAIAAGTDHSLALCADGTLAAWGANTYGQLGDGTAYSRTLPVAVNATGVLAGKTVIAITSGASHNLALCTDGTLVAWGYNSNGQLGNGTTTSSVMPLAVTTSGWLADKSVTAISAGSSHSLALCADGTMAAWGSNSSSVPVAVSTVGVLAGKTVSAIAEGSSHSLALCSDGTLTAWGSNSYGQLGTDSGSSVPIAVTSSGVFFGRFVSAIAAGYSHSLALCSDGILCAWGSNSSGQLGNGTTTNSSTPVAVTSSITGIGAKYTALATGLSNHVLALVAVPVSNNSNLASLSLNPGFLTTPFAAATKSYVARVPHSATTVTVTPADADANASLTVNGIAVASGSTSPPIPISPGNRTVTIGVTSQDGACTTSYVITVRDDATLSGLALSAGTLDPAFAGGSTSYVNYVSTATGAVTVTPAATDGTAAITVNGAPVASGESSGPLDLAMGTNAISVKVTAIDGATTTYQVSVIRQTPVTYAYNSAAAVAVTSADFTATGNTVNLTLNFAPPVGTSLTVVNNTGTDPIHGAFDNLAQGQWVSLPYGGLIYQFVASYYGGTGNDLVLEWANNRIVSWGSNTYGQLGNNSTTNSSIVVPVDRSGVLAGKTVTAIATGSSHSLALCSDGTLAAWGYNTYHQLGTTGTANSSVPVAVDRSGVLAGKTVVAAAAGGDFSIVLCTDGTLAAWGNNASGQLGNGTTSTPSGAVLVDRTGVLSGKTVIAVAAGGYHALVLCADGTLAAWGSHSYGQLGNISSASSPVPVLVDQSSVLAGKTVTAIAAGSSHSLALCSDGTPTAWGYNNYGQLGNNSASNASIPLLVPMTGALSGKTPTAMAAGSSHSLALCSDGTLAGWGYNYSGQLGNNSVIDSSVPVWVNQTGVLAGKTVTAIRAGGNHNLAYCADGTLAAWGNNGSGQLGNSSTTNSNVPVSVTTTLLSAGERIVRIASGTGSSHNLAIVAMPLAPFVTSLAATAISDTASTLNASVNAQGATTTHSFEYGLTNTYGMSVAATPATGSGTTTTPASANLGALMPGTTYHYRVVASSAFGSAKGADMTFTTRTDATLSGLVLSDGALYPTLSNNNTSYAASVSYAEDSLTVMPVCQNINAVVTVNGVVTATGTASAPVPLAVGNNTVNIVVTDGGVSNTRSYVLTVTRLPQTFTYHSGADVPVTVSDFVATGKSLAFVLNHAPVPGVNLSVVRNTGPNPIQGTFDNLAQWQTAHLVYDGIGYDYLTNYFGGTGNDLVLQWANTRVATWGANSNGQLGINSTINSNVPLPVVMSGILAGKSVVAFASGNNFSMALCADGTLATWGANGNGQLGNGVPVNTTVPGAVDQTGVLAGRKVVAIAAGSEHCLALCEDGTLAAWGYNLYGQLGNNSTTRGDMPVLVDQTGVLAGKTIIAIAAAGSSSLALCSDGFLAAWGSNGDGQLGNNGMSLSSVPVAVESTGVLAGKRIIAIATGGNHCLVLCADGSLAAWGANTYGKLGNNSTTSGSVPVAVTQSGVLAGKSVIAVSANYNHSLALCQDGTVAAWGNGTSGQLGNGTTSNSSVPVMVSQTGVLAGKLVTAIIAGGAHSLAFCSDGTLTAWGANTDGQLGNAGNANSALPVAVHTGILMTAERFIAPISGYAQNLALIATPPPATATTLTASTVLDTQATLHGSVTANGTTTTVAFEYGLTNAYGMTATATPASTTGATATPASATITGLRAGATYHYRVLVRNNGAGGDMTFTTSTLATLSGLGLSDGALSPSFDPVLTDYLVTVPYAVSTMAVTPVAASAGAAITVNGVAVVSGAASGPLSLAVGNTTIRVVATAADALTYTLTVTRLPQAFTYNSADDIPVTADGFAAAGDMPALVLNFAPVAGTALTIVKTTGGGDIRGFFGNLAQGQVVQLGYGGVSYAFAADYHGGTGNDLTLQWANTRLMTWGGTTYGTSVPSPVYMGGALSGKALGAISIGGGHYLALCRDGSIVAWGSNDSGQLGDNSTTNRITPTAVDQTGWLAGRIPTMVTAGGSSSFALCQDGSVAAWGYNGNANMGDNTRTNRYVPVGVSQTGVLAGRKVVAIDAGSGHTLALCADGALAAWGVNSYGQCGNNSTNTGAVPVLTDRSGVLAGKTISAIAAGDNFSLALCSDGTMAGWGYNSDGQLGNTTTTHSLVPVAVTQTGVLSGKSVTAIAAGASHCLALCSDGTLAAWGGNANGQLGNSSTTGSSVPVLVNRSGVLSGKSVTAISAGSSRSMALCSDGTLAAWGYNYYGQLGDNSTTDKTVPVAVNTKWLRTGERFVAVQCGGNYTVAMVAAQPAPLAQTLPATAILDTGATLNGSVNANASATTITMEYGLSASYGEVALATPASAAGTTATAVSCVPGALRSGTTYHYRVLATSAGGTTAGNDMTFTTTTRASLAGLALSDGTLTPAFHSSARTYLVTVPDAVATLTVTPTAADPLSTVRVNGALVALPSTGVPVALATGESVITVDVTAADGGNMQSYGVRVVRLPMAFVFNSAADVPVTADGFVADGRTVQVALGCAPAPGTCLTLVRNTGIQPIQGAFTNLARGGIVNLTYNGASYAFVANYYGGTGNDLVLQWANSRLMAWGRNLSGQLDDGTTNNSSVPVPCKMTGALAGKTVTAVAGGNHHCLALCSDNSLAAWGFNDYGQLGNNSTASYSVPVSADMTGLFAGRTVVTVVVGAYHSLALCSDGTVAAWGYNKYGQLGNNSTANSNVPAQVSQSGVLAGRSAIALAAGVSHSLALCADGSVAAWGSNSNGQLGNSAMSGGNVPVMVDRAGVLAGKTVIAIAAGNNFSVALCSDGTLAAWGINSYGQLGNNSTTDSSAPVRVIQTGVLAGKTISAIAAGNLHGLALCSDGSVAAWGMGMFGALGNGSTSNSQVPVLVNRTGVLASRTITAIAAGSDHSVALCSDGAIVTWGYNSYGQLGNNSTTTSTVPVLVNTGALGASERFLTASSGYDFNVSMVAMLPPPTAATLAATTINDTTAVLNGNVISNGGSAAVTIEYGLTAAYGASLTATPATVAGITTRNVSATLSGLTAGTGYHYRVVANQAGVIVTGGDMTFTTDSVTLLADLTLSAGVLVPAFAPGVTDYVFSVPSSVTSVRVTPVAAKPGATITVNGSAVTSGTASGPLDLSIGGSPVTIVLTSAGGDKLTYRVTAVRLPATFVFSSATDVPLTVSELVAAGNTASYVLNFAPAPGTVLMMVRNTGANFIRGVFDNLAQGQRVQLTHAGITYHFIANYYGGNGNDMVLQWADSRLLSWGGNAYGQLGNNSTADSRAPQPVDMTGALANKTLVAIVSGDYHSLALCADGTLAAWGNNAYGQLGNGSTTPSGVPVAVNQAGVLAGRRVVAVSSRSTHNLALCADGTVAAWGSNIGGKLGAGVSGNSDVPVMVDMSGVLAGRKVTAIAAGGDFSLFLCADGSLAACGYNASGQLGNNSTTSSNVPVSVDRSGVLAGRTVTSIAAGNSHSLVMCADGILVSWGWGASGELGNNTTSSSKVPVLADSYGALLTGPVTAIACGMYHNLALCGDGSLAAWGSNISGQLGNLSTSNASTPIIINPVGMLAGKSLAAAAGGGSHSLAIGSDGILTAWGSNANGQLGNGITMNSTVPLWINGGSLYGGERPMRVSAGSLHSLMMAAMALPSVTPLPAGAITTSGATLNCEVNANGNATTVSFEYGATTDYGNTLAGSPAVVSGGATTPVNVILGASAPGTVCHYRVVAANRVGIVRSADRSFVTPSDNARLASISLSAGTLTPAFDSSVTTYLTTVPFAVDVMRVTPITVHPGAVVRINGVPATSGTASDGIALALGDTAITVEVSAEDGITRRDYAISVTRIPMEFVFRSATGVPLTCGALDARGLTMRLALDCAPVPGTVLTAINNTGGDPIRGTFANLDQGRRVTLDYRGVHYDFAANYAGGTGNDLVLELLDIRPYDVDLDGIEDLIEYAFGTDPVTNMHNPPPQPVMAGGRMVIRFTEPEGRAGITYGVQSSVTLLPGNWSDIPDTGNGTEHVFSVPAGETSLFLRLKVTSP